MISIRPAHHETCGTCKAPATRELVFTIGNDGRHNGARVIRICESCIDDLRTVLRRPKSEAPGMHEGWGDVGDE